MKASKPLVIILIGPPGSGKGAQGELLSSHFNLYYLETSKVIEDVIMKAEPKDFLEIEGKKYFYLDERKRWETGLLCSTPFVLHLLKQKVERLAKMGENLILSGSPRTLYEAERAIPELKDLYGKDNIKTIVFTLSSKESISRNSHRRICELMRHPILFNKETEKLTLCPLDGSKLLKRKGLDDPKVIETRLKEYESLTVPVIEYLKKQGIELTVLNGDQSVESLYKDILNTLKMQ